MKIVFAAVVAATAVLLHADTLTWTGQAGDNKWKTASNWSPEDVPGYGDRVVFDVGAGNSVCLDVTPPSGSSCQLGDIEVRSGNVYLTGPDIYLYGASYDHELLISEGALLCTSNSLYAWRAGGYDSLYKRGPGTFVMCKHVGNSMKKFHVEAGLVDHPNINAVFLCDVDIYADAEIYLKCGRAFLYDYILNVHKGGLLRLKAGDGVNYFAAVVGEGEIYAEDWSPLEMNLPPERGPYVFSGSFSSSQVDIRLDPDGEYLIASTNALAAIKWMTGVSALRFAPDLPGAVRIRNLVPDGTLNLADTNGAPVDVELTVRNSNGGGFDCTGCGDLVFLGNVHLTNAVIATSGRLVAGSGATVYMGNGTTGCDCDFSTVSELTGPGAFIIGNREHTAVTMPVTGSGDMEVYGGGASFSALNSTGGTLYFNTNVTVEATEDKRSWSGFGFCGGYPSLCIKSGLHYYNRALIANDKVSLLKKPRPVNIVNDVGLKAEMRMEGGEFHASNNGLGLLELAGGKYIRTGTYSPCSDATEQNPSRVVFDGGEMSFSLAGVYESVPFKDTNSLEVAVGEGGAVFSVCEAHYDDYARLHITRPIVSDVVPPGKDGGLTRRGRGMATFHYPVSLSGPVALQDGYNKIGDYAGIDEMPDWFGTGSLTLENTVLDLNEISNGKVLNFASGDASRIVYRGASVLRLGGASGRNHHVVAGAALAAENSVMERGGKGSVLFVDESASSALDGSGSTFKVNGGVEVNAAGIVAQPVVALHVSGSNTHHPFTYDETLGFVRFTGYSADPSYDGKAVFWRLGRETYLNSDAGAIGVDANNKHLGVNATLSLGDGENPALVIIGSGSVGGSGVIDFGGSEGVVIISDKGGSSTEFTCRIAGNNGVTFAASPRTLKPCVYLNKDNLFTGGAYVSGVEAKVAAAGALGSGDVHVFGSERSGGCVRFAGEHVFANDFHLQGWGGGKGALYFDASATVAGDVDVAPGTRIRAAEGVCGVVSGDLTGDRLVLYDGAGTIVFSGGCTHTGGTEVVASTLVRSGADISLGSGDVLLDGGTLVFDASAQNDFPNRISGIGTVALKGTAPVSFSGDLSGLDASLDLMGTRQSFSAVPPFAVVTNSLPVKAVMEFASGLGVLEWGDVSLEGKISVKIGAGTSIDLGGREITIWRKEGEGSFVNGTVDEIRPLAGTIITIK